MATRTRPAGDAITAWLDEYLVRRSPIQLPDGAKDWMVRYAPWITIALVVLTLPALFIAFGRIDGAAGVAYFAVGTAIEISLMLAALPGLFARAMSGWRFMFYASVVALATSLLRGAVLSGLFGAIIALFVLFQIRALYRESHD